MPILKLEFTLILKELKLYYAEGKKKEPCLYAQFFSPHLEHTRGQHTYELAFPVKRVGNSVGDVRRKVNRIPLF